MKVSDGLNPLDPDYKREQKRENVIWSNIISI